MRPAKPRLAWWAPNGFAAIPTAALDPPQRAASPAAPALIGSGSPSRTRQSVYAVYTGSVDVISAIA
jgi:hypothetical protein